MGRIVGLLAGSDKTFRISNRTFPKCDNGAEFHLKIVTTEIIGLYLQFFMIFRDDKQYCIGDS